MGTFREYNHLKEGSLENLKKNYSVTMEKLEKFSEDVLKTYHSKLIAGVKNEVEKLKKEFENLKISELASNTPEKYFLEFIENLEKEDEKNPKEKLLDNYFMDVVFKFISRILFIKILEDNNIIYRKRLNNYGISLSYDLYLEKPVIKMIKGMVDDLKIRIDGSLFELSLIDVLIPFPPDIVKEFITELEKYSFKGIDRDFFGDLYEHYLDKLVEIKYPGKKQKNIKKLLGQYYTPKTIVNSIVENTIGETIRELHLESNKIKQKMSKINTKKQYLELFDHTKSLIITLKNLTIIDPAMGSGTFLVRVLEQLFDVYLLIENIISQFGISQILKQQSTDVEQNKEKQIEKFFITHESELRKELYGKKDSKDILIAIIKNNIFGVDINPDAVALAKMNLNIKGLLLIKKLKKMEKINNLIVADTIKPNSLKHEKKRNKTQENQELLTHNKFSFIIGNPPYVQVENLDSELRNQIYSPRNTESPYKWVAKRTDLFILFMEKSLKHLLKDKGKLGFIISYSFLVQNFAEKARKEILEKYKIEKIIDLHKFKVFKNASIMTIIIIISKEEPDENHEIQVFVPNMKKIYKLLDNNATTTNKRQSEILDQIFEKNFFEQRKVMQKWFIDPNENIVNSMIRLDYYDINREICLKMEKATKQKLDKIIIAKFGARGDPPSSVIYGYDEVEKLKQENKEEVLKWFKKMVRGSNIIDNLILKWSSPFLEEDKVNKHGKIIKGYNKKFMKYKVEDMYRPAFKDLFELTPKILFREVIGEKGFLFGVDINNKYYADHSMIIVQQKHLFKDKDIKYWKKNEIFSLNNSSEQGECFSCLEKIKSEEVKLSKNYPLWFLVGLFSSSLINFYFKIKLNTELHTYPNSILNLPLPKYFPDKIIEIEKNAYRLYEASQLDFYLLEKFHTIVAESFRSTSSIYKEKKPYVQIKLKHFTKIGKNTKIKPGHYGISIDSEKTWFENDKMKSLYNALMSKKNLEVKIDLTKFNESNEIYLNIIYENINVGKITFSVHNLLIEQKVLEELGINDNIEFKQRLILLFSTFFYLNIKWFISSNNKKKWFPLEENIKLLFIEGRRRESRNHIKKIYNIMLSFINEIFSKTKDYYTSSIEDKSFFFETDKVMINKKNSIFQDNIFEEIFSSKTEKKYAFWIELLRIINEKDSLFLKKIDKSLAELYGLGQNENRIEEYLKHIKNYLEQN